MDNHSPEVQAVVRLISALGGPDSTKVIFGLHQTRVRFEEMRRGLDQLVKETGPKAVSFRSNLNVYTEKEPVETAIVAYYDVSTSGELLAKIIGTRAVIMNELRDSQGRKLRFSNLGEQHVTIFIDMFGHWSSPGIIKTLQEAVRGKYFDAIRECCPLTVRFCGPYLTATGAIILEGLVYSDQVFRLRDAAANNLQYVPRWAERSIYEIVHTTLGYLIEASREQLASLNKRFVAIRKRWGVCSVRVREIRVGASRNKALTGTPICIGLRATRLYTLSSEGTIAALSKIRGLRSVWGEDWDLRNLVLEEALYWSEDPKASSQATRLAAEIVTCCLKDVSCHG